MSQKGIANVGKRLSLRFVSFPWSPIMHPWGGHSDRLPREWTPHQARLSLLATYVYPMESRAFKIPSGRNSMDTLLLLLSFRTSQSRTPFNLFFLLSTHAGPNLEFYGRWVMASPVRAEAAEVGLLQYARLRRGSALPRASGRPTSQKKPSPLRITSVLRHGPGRNINRSTLTRSDTLKPSFRRNIVGKTCVSGNRMEKPPWISLAM
jgi:hypothetical protein